MNYDFTSFQIRYSIYTLKTHKKLKVKVIYQYQLGTVLIFFKKISLEILLNNIFEPKQKDSITSQLQSKHNLYIQEKNQSIKREGKH